MTLDRRELPDLDQPSPSARRRRTTAGATGGRSLDEALFRAWQAGDNDAREQLWALLYAQLFTVAVAFCRKLAGPSIAEDAATDAFVKTLGELDPATRATKVPVEWYGEGEFVSYVRHRLVLRCRDMLRKERAATRPLEELPDDPSASPATADAVSVAADQSERVRGERWKRVVLELEACREACRERRALEGLVDAFEAYVRDRLVAASRRASGRAERATLAGCTLQELAERAIPERVEITREDMYRFVRARIGLAAQGQANTFYLRMRELRAAVGTEAGA